LKHGIIDRQGGEDGLEPVTRLFKTEGRKPRQIFKIHVAASLQIARFHKFQGNLKRTE
jgi:hypothetical protein